MSDKDYPHVPPKTLDPEEAARQLLELSAQISLHDEAYYQDDAPNIDDAAYDRLRQRLLALEATFPHLRRADSPSLRVGAAPSSRFAKVRHAVSMLSLGNAFFRCRP